MEKNTYRVGQKLVNEDDGSFAMISAVKNACNTGFKLIITNYIERASIELQQEFSGVIITQQEFNYIRNNINFKVVDDKNLQPHSSTLSYEQMLFTIFKFTQEAIIINDANGDVQYFGLVPRMKKGVIKGKKVIVMQFDHHGNFTTLKKRYKRGKAYKKILKIVF